MKEFFTSLLYAAVAGGISVAIAGKTYEKHLRYLAALLCTALLVSPLITVINKNSLSLPQMQSTVSADAHAAAELITAQMEEDAEKYLADHIFSQTGIKPTSVSIQIERENEKAQIKAVTIKIPSGDKVKTVKELVNALLGDIPTEVTDG